MTTSPTIPTTLTPIEQAEALLGKIRQFQRNFNKVDLKPGARLMGLFNALGLTCFPANQTLLDNLETETVMALRQEFLQLAVEQCGYSNMTHLFAQAIGLEMPPEPVREIALSEVMNKTEAGPVEETPGVRRWSRQSVLNWVNTPITLTSSKPNIYIQSHPYTDVIVQLLGAYGPLTIYQICALIMNQERVSSSQAASTTILTRVKEATRLLAAKQLISSRAIARKRGKLNLWVLEVPGQIYYASINDQPTPTAQEAGAKPVQLQHTFGTNQVLASMAGVAAMATRLGVFDIVINTILKETPQLNTKDRSDELKVPTVNLPKTLEWVRQPKTRQPATPTFGCRVEFMRAGTTLEMGQTERKAIIPDGMGRIIYDSDLSLPTLIQACNLMGDEADFPGSSATDRHYWPFILEYDRATEGAEFFAEKVEAYSKFYNTIKTAWPLDWGNKFPVILVVGEGSPVHLFTLMTAIRTALFRIKERNAASQRLGTWWFTNTEWFNQVYGSYLEPGHLTNWSRQIYPSKVKVSRKLGANSTKTSVKLIPGVGPNIWLPLSTKLERQDVTSISNYIAGRVAQPPSIMKGLKALPIPAVFNQIPAL